MTREGDRVFQTEFNGIGVVLQGKIGTIDPDDKKLTGEALEEMRHYELVAEFYLDDVLAKTMLLPVRNLIRSPELFFQYELEPGAHTLHISIPELSENVFMDITDMITYVR